MVNYDREYKQLYQTLWNQWTLDYLQDVTKALEAQGFKIKVRTIFKIDRQSGLLLREFIPTPLSYPPRMGIETAESRFLRIVRDYRESYFREFLKSLEREVTQLYLRRFSADFSKLRFISTDVI